MSEEATPQEAVAPKKRKSKLPMLLFLCIVLLGGGYMTLKPGGKPSDSGPKLGEVVLLEEFLVNLAGQDVYLRTQIGLHLADSFKKAELEKAMPAVRDAVLLVLAAQRLADVNTAAGKVVLKKKLAAAVNETLHALHPPKREPAKAKEPTKEPPADWDSPEGPVLKVYFQSFATQ